MKSILLWELVDLSGNLRFFGQCYLRSIINDGDKYERFDFRDIDSLFPLQE